MAVSGWLSCVAAAVSVCACGYPALAPPEAGPPDAPGLPGLTEPLVILQRPRRPDSGDIFQYASYAPGARLVQLSPPTPDGTLTTICCDNAGPEFAKIDISSYDISFDATSIVFSAKLAEFQH